jgi:hypothetical protein
MSRCPSRSSSSTTRARTDRRRRCAPPIPARRSSRTAPTSALPPPATACARHAHRTACCSTATPRSSRGPWNAGRRPRRGGPRGIRARGRWDPTAPAGPRARPRRLQNGGSAGALRARRRWCGGQGRPGRGAGLGASACWRGAAAPTPSAASTKAPSSEATWTSPRVCHAPAWRILIRRALPCTTGQEHGHRPPGALGTTAPLRFYAKHRGLGRGPAAHLLDGGRVGPALPGSQRRARRREHRDVLRLGHAAVGSAARVRASCRTRRCLRTREASARRARGRRWRSRGAPARSGNGGGRSPRRRARARDEPRPPSTARATRLRHHRTS